MGIDAAWWSEAAAPFAGTTLRGVSESTPPSNYVKDVLAPMFTEMTGINVELETTSWDQMYDKAIRDMEAGTGIYDFVYIEQDIIYGYLANNYLVNMTQALADMPNLAAPEFSFDNFSTFIQNFQDADGNVFGIPMEAFVKIYLYRTDLFENPEEQAAFEAAYGYPLAPATTHAQYRDIAEFFTRPDQELWGTTVQAASAHPASFYEFFESVAPTYGVYNWGINMDSWTATVENGGAMNSDAAKEALAWWLGNLAFAPPESTSSTWDEVGATFAAGRAAQGLVYGENAAWIATDPERSQVVGNVGVALPPLADGVLEAAEAGDGYIGYYDGGAFGLPTSSVNQEAALLWMQFVGLPQVQAEWAAASSRIVMDSTYEDPVVVAVDEATNGYFSLMQDQGYLFRGAPPFPFHPQLREVIAPFIYQAIAGELEAADALDQAAVAAEAELAALGYGS
ncbi:MAG: extracellular solute-binding protein [Chloroflexota bacterium]|nr:extracellular solute-binding protein [Chloroflexota bacterium]